MTQRRRAGRRCEGQRAASAPSRATSRRPRGQGPWGEGVVVDQREVDVVVGQQSHGLRRLVLADLELDGRMRLGQRGEHRHERAPDRGGEPCDAHDPGRLDVRIEVCAGGVERREDRHGVLREPQSGRREAHPATRGLDERSSRLASQHGELLRDRRRRVSQLIRDGAHGAAPGELEQKPEPPWVHCSMLSNGWSAYPA